jgi:uncharacterized protein
MQAELEKLLDLQTRDLALIETDQRLSAILEEIAGLDAELASARTEITAARTRHADAVKRREELETRIESFRTIQERRRSRLEMARGAREAQAMITEVEMARTVLVREESEWVKAAETVNDLERSVAALEERITELETGQVTDRGRLDSERASLESQRDEAQAARQEIAESIERSLRMRYDRLRSVRTAAVVVPLRGEACGACFTAVPRNRRTQIRAGLLLDACEACGVILFSDEG